MWVGDLSSPWPGPVCSIYIHETGGLVGLASHTGMGLVTVPNTLGVGWMLDEAQWECSLGQKSRDRAIFNLIIDFPLLDGIPSVLGGLAGQWHSWIPHSLPQPQLWVQPCGHCGLWFPKQPERDLGCVLLPGEG